MNNNVTTNVSGQFNETDESSILVYQHLYNDNLSRIWYNATLILTLLGGAILCPTIVIYENFGLDRKKRTLINRICSLIFTNISINTCIWSILRILRDNFGLLNKQFITPVALFSNSVWISTTLFITELFIVRFLYIVIWKRMRTLNDEFWNAVLICSNVLISAYFSCAIHLCGGHGYDNSSIIDIVRKEEKR